jgi:hypothetical protein
VAVRNSTGIFVIVRCLLLLTNRKIAACIQWFSTGRPPRICEAKTIFIVSKYGLAFHCLYLMCTQGNFLEVSGRDDITLLSTSSHVL